MSESKLHVEHLVGFLLRGHVAVQDCKQRCQRNFQNDRFPTKRYHDNLSMRWIPKGLPQNCHERATFALSPEEVGISLVLLLVLFDWLLRYQQAACLLRKNFCYYCTLLVRSRFFYLSNENERLQPRRKIAPQARLMKWIWYRHHILPNHSARQRSNRNGDGGSRQIESGQTIDLLVSSC